MSSDRTFGFVFTGVLTIVAAWPLRYGGAIRWWALGVAAGILIVSLLRASLLHGANRLWTRFGLLLHRIVSPVAAGLIYFLAVTPTGLLMRLARKDLLRLRRDAGASSYWIPRDEPGPPPETMANQF